LVVSGGAQTVEFAAGSAAAPSITFTGDTNTGIFFPAADTIAFTEGGAESMRIDSSGNVGIGTSSPSNLVEVSRNQNAETQVRLYNANAGSGARTVLLLGNNLSAGAAGIFLNSSTYSGGGGANALTMYMGLGAPITFETNATERMRIDSSGNLLVGTTSTVGSGKLSISAFNSVVGLRFTNTESVMLTFQDSVYDQCGFIYSIASTNTTSYNTSSDYRLKENVAPMTGALQTLSQLKPVTYTWKKSGSQGQGFIAHELQAVVPECVTGKKDAVDAEGKPVYQGIDTSFLVATLTAAIQEQQAMITELKATVDAQAALITQLQTDVAGLKGAK